MKWAWFAKIGKWIGKAIVRYGPTIADVVLAEKAKKKAEPS